MDWAIGYVDLSVAGKTIEGPLLSGTFATGKMVQEPYLLGGWLTPPVFNDWSFFAIEVIVFGFGFLCLRDAIRCGRRGEGIAGVSRPNVALAAAFFATIVFTLIVESLLSADTTVYAYPRQAFLIQVINVPLWVPVGWAFILYAVMRTTTMLGVPIYVAAILDAFLALNLDLTLDPIAIHRGWWIWNVADNPDLYPHFADYFGIPVINFMGWFVIVFAFSFFVRVARGRVVPGTKSLAGDIVPTFVAIIPALLLVFPYQVLGTLLMRQENAFLNGGFLACMTWLGCAALALRHARSFRRDAPFNRLLVSVPVVFHAFMFLLLFTTTAKSIPPAEGGQWLFVTIAELTIFFPVVAALGVSLYLWPYLEDLKTPGPSSPVDVHAAREVGKAGV